MKKVGIKTLVMAERFKSSDYVQIMRDLLPPSIENSVDPYRLKVPEFPMLNNIVVISDKEVKGMINFKEIEKMSTSKDTVELERREELIHYQDSTNI